MMTAPAPGRPRPDLARTLTGTGSALLAVGGAGLLLGPHDWAPWTVAAGSALAIAGLTIHAMTT
jgi:hypothetical protein